MSLAGPGQPKLECPSSQAAPPGLSGCAVTYYASVSGSAKLEHAKLHFNWATRTTVARNCTAAAPDGQAARAGRRAFLDRARGLSLGGSILVGPGPEVRVADDHSGDLRPGILWEMDRDCGKK
jgi:hypothetical protein